MKSINYLLCLLIASVALGQKSSVEAGNMVREASTQMLNYKTLSFRFSYEFNDPEAAVEEQIKGHFSKKGARFLIQAGTLHILNDGQQVCVIDNEGKEVNFLDQEEANEFIDIESAFRSYETAGKTGVYEFEKNAAQPKGFRTVKLTVKDAESEMLYYRFVVNPKQKIFREVVAYQRSGAQISLKLMDVKGNLPLPDDLFIFDRSKYAKSEYLIND